MTFRRFLPKILWECKYWGGRIQFSWAKTSYEMNSTFMYSGQPTGCNPLHAPLSFWHSCSIILIYVVLRDCKTSNICQFQIFFNIFHFLGASRLAPSRLWDERRSREKRATKSRGDDLSHLHGIEFNLHIVGGKLCSGVMDASYVNKTVLELLDNSGWMKMTWPQLKLFLNRRKRFAFCVSRPFETRIIVTSFFLAPTSHKRASI